MSFNPKYFYPWSPWSVGWEPNGDSRRNQEPYRIKDRFRPKQDYNNSYRNRRQRPYGSGHRYGQNSYQERWKSRDYYKGKNQDKNKPLHSDSDRLLADLNKAADNVTNDVNAQGCIQRATKKVKVEHSTTSASVDRPLVQKKTEEEHPTTYKLDKTDNITNDVNAQRCAQRATKEVKVEDFTTSKLDETIQNTQACEVCLYKVPKIRRDSMGISVIEATEQSVYPSFHIKQEEDEYDVKIGKAREQMINATKCTNLYRGIQEAKEATEQSVYPSFHIKQEEDEYDVKIGKAREQMINATKCTNLYREIQEAKEATEQSVYPSFHIKQEEDEYDVKIGKAREQMINATKCTNLYRGIQEAKTGKADPQTTDPAIPTTRWKRQYKAWRRLQLSLFGHVGGIEWDEEDAEL